MKKKCYEENQMFRDVLSLRKDELDHNSKRFHNLINSRCNSFGERGLGLVVDNSTFCNGKTIFFKTCDKYDGKKLDLYFLSRN